MAADGEQRATLIERHSYRSPADRPPVERPIRLAVIELGPRGRGNVVGKALAYAEYELAAVCDRACRWSSTPTRQPTPRRRRSWRRSRSIPATPRRTCQTSAPDPRARRAVCPAGVRL